MKMQYVQKQGGRFLHIAFSICIQASYSYLKRTRDCSYSLMYDVLNLSVTTDS